MNRRRNALFLLLVFAQGLHSAEEYLGRLWEAFPPARMLTGLVSADREAGFLVINIGLFIFGLWCWLIPVRRDYPSARGFVWFWVVIEMINGLGHPLWSLYQSAYTPGVATASILLILAILLCRNLLLSDPDKAPAIKA